MEVRSEVMIRPLLPVMVRVADRPRRTLKKGIGAQQAFSTANLVKQLNLKGNQARAQFASQSQNSSDSKFLEQGGCYFDRERHSSC
ncbi:uncharacterized protein LOC120268948 isoform X2 [Dioscorea cayenensis subsp. rotundata]|uniref:Uncharacterized protein LOC120268948 isoform X2 n=1 Tax=Dioscorea cayennensis subsp. rotundata TaxID=55577 RepID=A0AB40BZ73_DIOCR|nr:uncharacterized protein LOC120268948 isoform X2 [Dioscorea cayenensis subsp. rotundata]